MFSTPSTSGELQNYDFEKEENAAKWKGVFINSLRKVSFYLLIIELSYFGGKVVVESKDLDLIITSYFSWKDYNIC